MPPHRLYDFLRNWKEALVAVCFCAHDSLDATLPLINVCTVLLWGMWEALKLAKRYDIP